MLSVIVYTDCVPTCFATQNTTFVETLIAQIELTVQTTGVAFEFYIRTPKFKHCHPPSTTRLSESIGPTMRIGPIKWVDSTGPRYFTNQPKINGFMLVRNTAAVMPFWDHLPYPTYMRYTQTHHILCNTILAYYDRHINVSHFV